MEKKGKITVYLPQKLYIEIYERHLEHHFSHLVSLLVEEFLKATDVRISWAEMPSKAEQREYLERKLKEFLSRSGLSSSPPAYTQEPSKPPVQEKKETSYVQEPPSPPMRETPKETYTTPAPQPVKEEKPPSTREDLELDEEVLRRIESLW
jgi:hypothetical protein